MPHGPELKQRIFELTLKRDSCDPEYAECVQADLDTAYETLQCITKLPLGKLKECINAMYPAWAQEHYSRHLMSTESQEDADGRTGEE